MATDDSDLHAENNTLQKALHQVFRQSHSPHRIPEDLVRDTGRLVGNDGAAHQSGNVGEKSQQGHHHDHRQQTRHDQIPYGRDRQHLQGVDLLGHLHRANLGGDGGACSTSHDDGREHRTQFARHRQTSATANHFTDPVLDCHVSQLESDNHPGERRGHQDDEQAVHTQKTHLIDGERDAKFSAHDEAQAICKEPDRATDVLQHGDDKVAYAFKESQHVRVFPWV